MRDYADPGPAPHEREQLDLDGQPYPDSYDPDPEYPSNHRLSPEEIQAINEEREAREAAGRASGYDGVSDGFDYKIKIVRDDTTESVENKIMGADLTIDCKITLLNQWYQFCSQDYILTNHFSQAELRKRFLEFKLANGYAQAESYYINLESGELNTINTTMKARFKTKLTRGAGGFTTANLNKTSVDQHITEKKEEPGQLEESGVAGIVGRLRRY